MSGADLVLRIPFRVGPGRFFSPGVFDLEGSTAELFVQDDWHVLYLRGQHSEDSAKEVLSRLCRALEWVGLETRYGIQVDCEIEDVSVRDEPAPPDSPFAGAYGFANEGRPIIYRQDRRIVIGRAGQVGVRIDAPLDTFVEYLRAGSSIRPSSERPATLRLALDLFLGSFFEGSSYAQFVARIAVLEVLKGQQDQPPEVRDSVDRWIVEVDSLAGSSVLDQSASDSLRGSLRYLKRESIGRAIFRLVDDALGSDDAREAKSLYNLRSQMLHEGELAAHDLSSELATLTDLDQRLLRVLLTQD